ncbi:lipopolysaccharide heptosyltransferase II [Campylobacter hepaticus]|uniref:lipopolysaccharide heptosyltransferase II n=1 Tax=Campylobacter hepaticus TaxID=1813019 RepID=A0A424YZE8_9BACT|nr:lipopolysaccharide heptosyltransferase II [Campylobacter hepaticus]MDX2330655.1 lipopolysaccharide heptosyltransferase II [Campylobacter hepaticus]MDX2371272.1 lipopolysaccharide heptosyltransferase II [Campylobacter hepaticus]MDX2396521.1 lipopolysaccharide heptosyltransferase II [Campylobacter hepaticus]MDX5508430.1 lipopolysaccharide heptosyltransferase II [Campylobacter hepaticus]QOW63401.1 lipopolysaccharide heptosyltransferase II [Campylobacter hepaticus]
MKILIHLPTWLGDAVMASSALYGILNHFKNAHFILYGSFASTALFKEFPNAQIIIENRKTRYKQALILRNQLGKIDLGISFKSAFSSKIILHIFKIQQRFFFNKYKFKEEHQVLKYLYFIENSLSCKIDSKQLQLPFKLKSKAPLVLKNGKKILGLNPGAHFGSAKRWDANYFATVALNFAKTHEILIFGAGKTEQELCDEIASILQKSNIKVKNLCNKTSIKRLCQNIAFCDIFITNDSGPMHISAAYKIKTVAIFGPTKFTQTSPWQNENAKLVHLNLDCMPCMQKICPLKHHKCMQDLKPQMVIEEVKKLISIF